MSPTVVTESREPALGPAAIPGDADTAATAAATTGVTGRATVERRGPVDELGVEEILALLPELPSWPPPGDGARQRRLRGARRVLEWLATHPGTGWQQRWQATGADTGLDWLSGLAPERGRDREALTSGLRCLLLARVVLPSYGFLTSYKAHTLFTEARATFSPTMFARVEAAALERGVEGRAVTHALAVLAKLVLHTGRDLDDITATDFAGFRDWSHAERGRDFRGLITAWDLLAAVVDLPGPRPDPWANVRLGQRSAAQLIDRYPIVHRPIRDLLIRYLGELEQRLDHSTVVARSTQLAQLFWADLEAHHPGIDSLRLSRDIVTAWKQRLHQHTRGGARDRLGVAQVLVTVRAFYLDIAEWAIDEPSWAAWVVPCPIHRRDVAGANKHRAAVTARTHQRIRDRLPHLPALADTAYHQHRHWAAVLTTARETPVGAEFTVPTVRDEDAVAAAGSPARFRRVTRRGHADRRYRPGRAVTVEILTDTAHGRTDRNDAATGTITASASATSSAAGVSAGQPVSREVIDVVRREDDAFWAWAVIETLRHTGLRIEELLELTELALISYRLPTSAEVVPLLQVLPSKVNEERLLLVSPELASVLASIETRLRAENHGRVPALPRWDHHERVDGPALPHLFQRRAGPTRRRVLTRGSVHRLIQQTTDASGLRDRDGTPLRFTPHDFRRIFATEAVTGGLPVHIAARLLGHHDLNTTQSYLAVFSEELVREYRAYLERRRAVRPPAEYREPTADEWAEFEQHFERRTLELGSCARPYGTPCSHEHACLRCPMQRIDPAARRRLIEILRNLTDRIDEARVHGWLGDVDGLEHTLRAGQAKLAALDRATRPTTAARDLGMPVIPTANGQEQNP